MMENSHRLELMKALECKKIYENLRDDCTAETFIDVAHKTAMSIKNVAKGLSPDSSTRLMAASFTPRQTRLKQKKEYHPAPAGINKTFPSQVTSQSL